MFGALAFAELGAAIPEAGGEYAYLRRGLGPAWGFLFGWMHSIVGRPSSTASIAAGLMRFLSFFLPAVVAPLFTVHIAIPGLTGWIPPYDFVFTWAQPLAVFWLVLMTGINYLGVRLGGEVQVCLTSIKVLSVGLIIGVAFLLPGRGAPSPGSRLAHFRNYWLTHRVSCRLGRRPLGVRWMGRSQSRRVRSRTPTQFPARARRRGLFCRSNLFAV